MGVEWFGRMGDIPGLKYEPPVTIDRTTLPGHDSQPEVRTYDYDGRVRELLSWGWTPEDDDGNRINGGDDWDPDDEEGTSYRGLNAPVREYMSNGEGEGPDGPMEKLLQRLWEGLELPGEGSDYHFAVQDVVNNLWLRKLTEPTVLPWVEYLAWLDIRLVLAYPASVTYEGPDGASYYALSSFRVLIDVYIREGFLNEALGLARSAQRLNQHERAVADLETRLETIRSENVV